MKWNRKMRRLIVMSTLLLVACGGSDTVSYKDSEGNDRSVTVKDGGDTRTVTSDDGLIKAQGTKGGKNARFPSFAPQYPGATVQVAVDMDIGNGQVKGVNQHMITMQTKDTPDAVIAFYKGKAEATGKSVRQMDSATGPMLMIGGNSPLDAEGYVTAMSVGSGGTSVNVVTQERQK
jgi:hypothetical protein